MRLHALTRQIAVVQVNNPIYDEDSAMINDGVQYGTDPKT